MSNTVRKQLPTIDKLLAVLRADIGFKDSREKLRTIVMILWFQEVTCQPDRNDLIEKKRIVNLKMDSRPSLLNDGGSFASM